MNPVVKFEGLTKRFGAETALDGVSFEVPPGVVFALLGENGAGKTTAIRILLGLLEADGGMSRVLGLDSRHDGLAIRRRVGYVAERPTLYDWMTVAEIGYFAAAFYPDGFFTRYCQLAAGYRLPEHKRLRSLSKGMRAKVSLALAMAHDPDLLVLDEPTSGLDTLVRREFLQSMVDRAAGGKTVLLSSHQIGEVERVADIVAILHHGELLLVEPLDDLKRGICELTITLGNGALAPPPLPGRLLSRRRKPRQWQLLVRGAAEQDLQALRADPNVQSLEVRTPALEEIFVAFMHPAGTQMPEETATP
jgi:ABC-2 type transport system ATP-binding protein